MTVNLVYFFYLCTEDHFIVPVIFIHITVKDGCWLWVGIIYITLCIPLFVICTIFVFVKLVLINLAEVCKFHKILLIEKFQSVYNCLWLFENTFLFNFRWTLCSMIVNEKTHLTLNEVVVSNYRTPYCFNNKKNP